MAISRLIFCGCMAALMMPSAADAKARQTGTAIALRNVVLYPLDNAPAHVIRMNGTVRPTRAGRMIDMNDVTSYDIRVRHAEMVMSAATMQALMNLHILPQADTAIKRVSVSFGNGVILMRGVMKKGAMVGFTAQAVAAPTRDGEMQLTITKMKAAGIISKGMMHAVGLNLAKVAQPDNRQVFRIVGDTMIIPISSMFPSPRFYGPLRSVRVTPAGLTAVVGTQAAGRARDDGAAPYLSLRGGRVHFARLTMAPANLTMVPKARAATLGFSPRHYYRQLMAGYSISRGDYGLTSHIADYRSLPRR
jgi:hypothetical protein